MISIISSVESQVMVVNHDNHKVITEKLNRPKLVVIKTDFWLDVNWKWSFKKDKYV